MRALQREWSDLAYKHDALQHFTPRPRCPAEGTGEAARALREAKLAAAAAASGAGEGGEGGVQGGGGAGDGGEGGGGGLGEGAPAPPTAGPYAVGAPVALAPAHLADQQAAGVRRGEAPLAPAQVRAVCARMDAVRAKVRRTVARRDRTYRLWHRLRNKVQAYAWHVCAAAYLCGYCTVSVWGGA